METEPLIAGNHLRLFPSGTAFTLPAAETLSGMSASTSITGIVGSSPSYLFARDAYVPGNRYVDRKITISPADLYGATLYGFAMNAGYNYYGGSFSGPSIFFRADAGFTHPTNAQWVVNQRLSWGRA